MASEQVTGDAIAALTVSAVLGVAVIWQLATGNSYLTSPPEKVFRATDPFSYWLSVLIQLVVVLVLAAGSAIALFQTA